MELRGIRFALASEIDSARRFDEALIKKLTSGDTLRGTALRSSAFQFSPEFKIWLLTNHLPFARDGSHGFWRRIKVIPFNQTFRGDALKSNLFGRLSTEKSGILKWCVLAIWNFYWACKQGRFKGVKGENCLEWEAIRHYADFLKSDCLMIGDFNFGH